VLGWALRDLTLVEDLILMCVEHDVVDSGLLIHEAVPKVHDILEGVMDHHGRVTVAVANGSPTIVVEFLESTEVQGKAERLVKKLDGGDHVGVGRVTLGKTTDGVESLGDGVPLLPADRTVTATIVKTVL